MNDVLLVVVIVVALGFDFTNGFHDTANAVATSVSTRALIGGLVGAALAQSGEKGVLWHGLAHKVAIPALIAPLLAFAGAFLLLIVIYWVFRRLTRGVANRGF